ncbi:response regulator [Treponema sp. HNW]|uniref:response regulator n=1 Tax=Treponema sp. HNW TaxID=3116654 RepID=UPI003D11B8CD
MSAKTHKTVIYSALEVANICGVVNQTAINWIRNGYLSAFTTPGGQYRVYLDDLIDFMKKRKMRIPEDLLAKASREKRNLRFLIVDDDKGLNTVLSKFLQREFKNSEIYQAFDGFEAGAFLVDKKPACVILDLDLPGVDGFKLCKKIRTSAEFGNPLIFVVTALNEEGIEEKCKALGADEFYYKPLNLNDIAEVCRGHFEK